MITDGIEDQEKLNFTGTLSSGFYIGSANTKMAIKFNDNIPCNCQWYIIETGRKLNDFFQLA